MSDPICSSCGAATDAVHLVCEGCEQEWALRAERAEAAHERAQQQANDALSEAARLKERVAELEWSKDRGWQTHLEAEQEAVSLRERAEAAEARERAKDEALRQALNRMIHVERWRCGKADSVPMCHTAIDEACAALAQQPADQPAQGERLDPHTLERAAQKMDELAAAAQALADACDRNVDTEDWLTDTDRANQYRQAAKAIRNLRGDT